MRKREKEGDEKIKNYRECKRVLRVAEEIAEDRELWCRLCIETIF